MKAGDCSTLGVWCLCSWVCVCVCEHLWNAQCVSLCACVSATEKWEANGGVEMRLCAVLWDLGICVAVIINRLAPSKITRDWKLIHKVGLQRPLHLLILCLSISPSFSPNITEQLHHPPPTHPQKNKIPSNATKYSHTQTDGAKQHWGEQLDRYKSRWHGVQEWHKVCVGSNEEVFVCFLFSFVMFAPVQCLSPSLHCCTGSFELTGSEQRPRSLVPRTSNKGLKAQKGLLIKYGWSQTYGLRHFCRRCRGEHGNTSFVCHDLFISSYPGIFLYTAGHWINIQVEFTINGGNWKYEQQTSLYFVNL